MKTFVEVLADKLERALPGRVRVERRPVRRLAREKQVRSIECEVGERRYVLTAKDGVVDTRRANAVRGIVLKTEPLGVDAWIDALARDLAEEARASEQSRLALEELLGA